MAKLPFELKGKTVFVAGHRGMVGSALVRRLAGEGVELLTLGRGEVDLRDQAAVFGWFAARKPQAVFLAAAKVGGILANSSYPAPFLYENLMIEANVIHTAWKMGVPLDRMVVWDPHETWGGLTPEQARQARLILWKGHCSVHTRFNVQQIEAFRKKHPDGKPAVKVSFDRPYSSQYGNPGNGGLTDFEPMTIAYLEKHGYDVTYVTDVDMDADPSALLSHQVVLISGHSEYWSKEMYDGAYAARDAGVSLAFITSNEIFWQVRIQPNAEGTAGRIVVAGGARATGTSARPGARVRDLHRPSGQPARDLGTRLRASRHPVFDQLLWQPHAYPGARSETNSGPHPRG